MKIWALSGIFVNAWAVARTETAYNSHPQERTLSRGRSSNKTWACKICIKAVVLFPALLVEYTVERSVVSICCGCAHAFDHAHALFWLKNSDIKMCFPLASEVRFPFSTCSYVTVMRARARISKEKMTHTLRSIFKGLRAHPIRLLFRGVPNHTYAIIDRTTADFGHLIKLITFQFLKSKWERTGSLCFDTSVKILLHHYKKSQ